MRDIGDVTLLINNAGILNLDGVMNIPDKKVKKLLDVNVYAPILVSQYKGVFTYNGIL